MSERLTYTILDSQLPRPVEVPGYIERRDVMHRDVLDTYDQFARRNHGALIRGAGEWEEYWRWENEEERTAAVYYDDDNRPTGCMLYWIERDVFHIKEMFFLTREAQIALWSFVTAHDSMLDKVTGKVHRNDPVAFLMKDCQIEECIEPYYMARIVDVAGFLSHYPFAQPAAPLHFVVKDSVAEWNEGVFSLEWKGTDVLVGRERLGHSVELDIRTLTAMCMGFRRPAYFRDLELLRTQPETLAMLEDIIPQGMPYFSDYF